MAGINQARGERTIHIKKWLGLNENPDGDTNLKIGEAAEMSNFRITDDGSLQVRPGSANVAGLLSAYTISVADEKTTVKTDMNHATSTFTAYPAVSVSAGGILSLSGTPVTVTAENIASFGTYYCFVDGRYYKVGTCTRTRAAGGTAVRGGKVSIDTGTEVTFKNATQFETYKVTLYPDLSIINGDVSLYGTPTTYGYWDLLDQTVPTGSYGAGTANTGTEGKIFCYTGRRYSDEDSDYGVFMLKGNEVSFLADDSYAWQFYEVTATTNSSDTEVKGIWSGYVAGTEYIAAACNGHLWSLTESEGVWSKADIGTIDTSGRVLLFGFGNRLYILDGTDYKVWDGTTLTVVSGYAPLVATATPPAGEGTPLERKNRLTGAKRQRFSPDGTATAFKLCESGISRVEWVKVGGVPQSVTVNYTVNLSSGTVTFTSAPAAGENTVEIKWAKGGGERSEILAMHFCELYNGANDARIFLYGDDSNKAIYSGLEEDGQPSAEYFPELNTMSVGDENTPITSMVRHQSRLLVFKEDSAYSVFYDTITLEDGSATAGFYVTPINRAIGNCARGQACLVENRARTLDGRSIYEWTATGTVLTGDQRNAQRISQRVEQTLGKFSLPDAVTYFDKINHEYYVVQNGTALVNNTENDAWYVYRDFPALCLIVYGSDLYFGTADGYIRRFSRDYLYDNGESIAAYWESGSMDFGANNLYKNSPELWVGLKPERRAAVNVTVQTDAQNDYDDVNLIADCTRPASCGLISFLDIDFSRFSFGTSYKPKTQRLKIKVKRFTYYKLIFTSLPEATATLVSAGIRVRYSGKVR